MSATTATRAVVSRAPGQPAALTLYAADGTALGVLEAGPHYLVGLAGDLIEAARPSFGLMPSRQTSDAAPIDRATVMERTP